MLSLLAIPARARIRAETGRTTMRRALPRKADANGKRDRSRARLTEAALKVMSERGITAASVSEIAAAADMANGTFYLHFQNKAEVVAAVCGGVTLAMHTEMDEGRLAITDGAERVAFGTQQFIEIAADEPAWGRLLLSAFAEFDAIKDDLSRYMRKDVALGAAQGRFAGPCDEFRHRLSSRTAPDRDRGSAGRCRPGGRRPCRRVSVAHPWLVAGRGASREACQPIEVEEHRAFVTRARRSRSRRRIVSLRGRRSGPPRPRPSPARPCRTGGSRRGRSRRPGRRSPSPDGSSARPSAA